MNKIKFYGGKIAIVTGGASGIGKAICEYLAKYGATVIVADINFEGATEVESKINNTGGSAKAVKLDVSNKEQVKEVILNTRNDFGQIDFLFNNAGIGLNGEFQDFTIESWHRIININLYGVIYGCHYVYPIMLKQGYGQIVNTASLAGLIPGGLTSSYSATKHAVVGFTTTFRAEAKLYGIKVNALCPGYIKTGIQDTTHNVTEYLNSEKNRNMDSKIKPPTAEDVINKIMRGVKKNKAIIISPRWHKLFWLLYRMLPNANIRMFTMIIKKMKEQG